MANGTTIINGITEFLGVSTTQGVTSVGGASGTSTSTPWPIGADGDLSITDGSTVNIAAGSVKDYSSITITNGSILNIEAGSAWTIIGCSGDMTMDSTSRVKLLNGEHTGGTFTATAPDGTALSYTITQANGGGGGQSGESPGGSTLNDSGSQNSGNGGSNGGRGGNGVNRNATSTRGGNGGDGIANGTGGLGATTYGGSGATGGSSTTIGTDSVNEESWNSCHGAPGGGGFRGRHGQGLYLRVNGTITLVHTQSISAFGQAGGNGGTGGDGTADGTTGGYTLIQPGAGGGGGAGGSGGKVIIKYGVNGSAPIALTSFVSVVAGFGGFGGSHGVATDTSMSGNTLELSEGNGSSGSNGTVGSKTATAL